MSNTTPPSHPRLDAQSRVQGQQPPPPIPPPLPPLPQRYSQRAATAIAKLAPPWLTSHPTRLANAQSHPENTDSVRDALAARSGSTRYRSHVHRSSSPSSSRSAVHRAERPIAAFDICPYQTHAVLAGREILKTIKVDSGGSAVTEFDIRTGVNAYAEAHGSSKHALNARHRDQLNANDVKWSNGTFDTIVATAATGGRIVLYDLNSPKVEIDTLVEHARQVHRLAFNPNGGQLLLSGSQDGGVKLWDLRSNSSRRHSQATFNAHDQGIRDVKWSVGDAFEFATGTEGGVVQRWDMRRPIAPIVKLNAHKDTCHSIDYHPGGKHLVSGGADKVVKVWDTTRTDKRQSPTWTVHTPHDVLKVCWRPSTQARSEDGEAVPGPSSHIATIYDRNRDPRIHVWDFRRPGVPCQEIDRYDEPATDMLWHSDNLLWTVGHGSDGLFTQTDLRFVPKPIQRLRTNNFATAPDGSVAMFSDPREIRRHSIVDGQEETLYRVNTGSSTGEKFSSSMSANEGSLDDNNLLASTLRRRRKKASNQRLITGNSRNDDDARFGQSETPLNLEATFVTSQVAAHGHVRGVFDAKAFQYLAEHYEKPPDLSRCNSFEAVGQEIEKLFLKNSDHANRAGDHGLAHIWRILAWSVKKELEDWAKNPELERRRENIKGRAREISDAATPTDMIRTASGSTARDHLQLRSPLSALAIDGGSNVPTPRVRPFSETSAIPLLPAGSLGEESMQTADASGQQKPTPSKSTPAKSSNETRPDRFFPLELTPRISVENTSPSTDDISDKNPSPQPIPIPSSHGINSAENQTSSPPQSSHNDSIPSFQSDFEEQLAIKRAALSEYRQTPRPVLRFGAGALGSSIPGTPSRGMDVIRPNLDRYDSGESFQVLSESMGSHRTSLPMSSFEDSPVKRRKESPDYERQVVDDREIEDRLLVPELGKQAMMEESERLLEEIAGSSVLPEPESAQMVRNAGEQESNINEQSTEAGIKAGEARRPSQDMKAIVLKSEFVTSQAPDTTNKPGHTPSSLAQPPNSFRHAIDLALASSKPWHASSFLPSLLSHYLSHLSFIQLPTYLALYLYPIYPSLFPILDSQSHLPTSSHPDSQIDPEIQPPHPLPLTIHRLNATILSYHAQLSSLSHSIPATRLRNDCATIFPTVTTRAEAGKVGGYWCRNCQKMNKGPLGMKGRCTRCAKDWGGCMVCGELKLTKAKAREMRRNMEGRKADSDARRGDGNREKRAAKGGRWTYCSTCAHSGHAVCLSAWFNASESKGVCAVAGCNHACAPGPARDEQRAALARERAELAQLRKGRGVLSDDRVVRESKAVQAVKADAADDKGLLIPVVGKDAGASALVGIPMESVREEGMLEGGGIGMGRGRGRWRSAQNQAAGNTSAGLDAAAGPGRRVGRNSVGSNAGVGAAGVGNAESRRSLEEGSGGSGTGGGRGGNLRAGSSGGGGGSGGGLGIHRRVTILEPGASEGMEGEFEAGEGVISSSVP